MTVYEENATLAANRNRELTADLVLDVACKDAAEHMAAGHFDVAEHVLHAAARSAERILGRITVGSSS